MNIIALPLAMLAGISPSLDHASVSAYAIDSGTNKVLLDENSQKSLVPASCMKVITTVAALFLLGPETRFQTDLEYDGEIDIEGTLHGNVYIHGGGDPCLGSDRISPSLSWNQQIEAWALAIIKLGIKKIEGKVIGNATRWEKALAVPSWNWEDLGNYYGAGASALSFHENYYSLFFKPANKTGDDAAILRLDPPISSIILLSEVKTGPAGSGDLACIYGSEFSSIQHVRGTIPAEVDEFSIKGSIPDPATTCADFLDKDLENRGIVIEHCNLQKQSAPVVFHTTYSPPIKDIVYWTNQKSINLYAEHLLKKMGEVTYNEGSTLAGIKAVTAFLYSQGIDLNGFNMADGSGLSRKNCITAKQLVSVLLKVKESAHFPTFLRSLPQKNDRCREKSGSMAFIKGLTGFIDDIAFAVLVNQSIDPNISKKMDLILSELSSSNQ